MTEPAQTLSVNALNCVHVVEDIIELFVLLNARIPSMPTFFQLFHMDLPLTIFELIFCLAHMWVSLAKNLLKKKYILAQSPCFDIGDQHSKSKLQLGTKLFTNDVIKYISKKNIYMYITLTTHLL